MKTIERFLAHLALERGFSTNTVAAYRNDLYQLMSFLNGHGGNPRGATRWSEVSSPLLQDYVASLGARRYAPATRARKIAAIKSFFGFLTAEGLVARDTSKTLGSPRVGKALPHFLSQEEMNRLLAQAAKRSGPDGRRDQAMLELLYASGLRVTELVSLNLGDVVCEGANAHVRCLGKGGKERLVPIHSTAASAVRSYWQEARPALLRGNQKERALFLNRRGERLTRQGLWLILKTHAREASIQGPITPHTMRHSFATHLLHNGASLRELQELLGHANIATTEVYTHLTDDHIRKEYEKAHPRAR
ncbi:MAG: site-specific tyrosine recombinase XerD [Chloroflexi bacterium]|nr:site-specific tyrosine recombinase XerD [Chloroflexota bacterium]